MLPIKSQDSNEIPLVVGVIGGNEHIFAQLAAIVPSDVALLSQSDLANGKENVDSSPESHFGLLACDAVIGVIDGDQGIGTTQISTWTQLVDHDIPRIILASNTVQGRADFDEVLALSELVLNEDIAMRFYPVVDDAEEKYVGLLDVLTHEIIQPNKSTQPADSEHVSLTIDEHNELIDLLALADLDYDTYESHALGNPISLPKLRGLWDHSQLVTVLPFDNEVSNQILANWLSLRKPIWIPNVTIATETYSVSDLTSPLGIGIANGVARIWNQKQDSELEVSSSDDHGNETIKTISAKAKLNLIFDSTIKVGDTIRPCGSEYLVSAPSF